MRVLSAVAAAAAGAAASNSSAYDSRLLCDGTKIPADGCCTAPGGGFPVECCTYIIAECPCKKCGAPAAASAVPPPAPAVRSGWDEPSAMGKLGTDSEYFYVGGFVAGGVQDAYLVYPTEGSGPFPIVSFAHGCCKKTANDTEHDYNAVLRHLASHGVIVASFNTCVMFCANGKFSADQLHLLSALRAQPSLHPVLAKADFTRAAVMGHSLGGGATVTSAASGADGVLAAVAIHPSNGDAAHAKVPTFYLCGEKDTTVRCSGVKQMYDQTPAGRSVFGELVGAGHLEIQTPLPGGRWDFYIVQFMLCHLNKDAAACANIYGTTKDALCTAGLMVACEHTA